MPAKYQIITNDMRARIYRGDYAAGQALPPQSTLMQSYGVALSTVRQAIDQLQKDRLIEVRHGRAMRVMPRSHRRRSQFQCGVITFNPLGLDEVIMSDALPFLKQASERLGINLQARAFGSHEEDDALAWSCRLDGVILVDARESFALRVLGAGCSAVVFGDLIDGPCPVGASLVSVDIENGIELATAFLKAMGHNAGVVIHGGGSRYHKRIVAAYESALNKVGLAGGWSFIHTGNGDEERNLVRRWIARQEVPPAVFSTGSMRACRLIEALRAEGLRVPEDVPVLSLSAAASHRLTVPDLSRFAWELDQTATVAVQALFDNMTSGQCRHHAASVRIILGGTCRHRLELDLMKRTPATLSAGRESVEVK